MRTFVGLNSRAVDILCRGRFVGPLTNTPVFVQKATLFKVTLLPEKLPRWVSCMTTPCFGYSSEEVPGIESPRQRGPRISEKGQLLDARK